MIINSKDQIIDYFTSGCKKTEMIGVENEKFIFDKKDKKRANYAQVVKVLEYLKKFGWQEIKEKNNLIGLKFKGKSITLEPGNQIELAGDQLKSIHEVCNESFKFQDQLNEACKILNFETLSIGYDPVTNLKDVPNNPKERYKIMSKEMPKKGELSLEMMYQTSGTQINLDYVSEKDFSNKFKLLARLVPFSIATFANSAVKDNKLSGSVSYRSKVWQSTSRGGLPDFFLEEMNFEKYADFIINTDLLFIQKNENYEFPKNLKYKDLIKNNKANFDNLKLHLSTIFTELRLKTYIELRSLDACEWDCHCAGPAFFTGLVYGNLDEALEIVDKWEKNDLISAYKNCHRKGLKTEINGKTILYWLEELLKISKSGLNKRKLENKNFKDERIYLKNLDIILLNKMSKAEEIILKFNNEKNISNTIR